MLLEANGLSMKFGEVFANRNINLSFSESEIVALVGKNGAGKSTFLQLATGQIRPSSGQVRVYDLDPTQTTAKSKFFFSPQFPGFPANLYGHELVDLTATAYGIHKEKFLQTMHLLGIDAVLKKAVSTLSGGQLRRFSVALGLAVDTPILFLDEPTAGLDFEARENFWKALKSNLIEDKLVLLVTHDLLEVEYFCQSIIFFKDGVCSKNILTSEVDRQIDAIWRGLNQDSPHEAGIDLKRVEFAEGSQKKTLLDVYREVMA
jgi:ABC-2 type transport system ATP-binding protein